MTQSESHPNLEAGAARPRSLSQLTGSEGGLWKVTTQSSHYLFDLDQGTVIRVPGPESSSSLNDVWRPLRSIRSCEVGVRGYWTMEPDRGDDVEYFWQYCTEIRSIEPVVDDDR